MDISGIGGQLSKWKAVTGQRLACSVAQRAPPHPHSLSLLQSVTGYLGSGEGWGQINNSIMGVFLNMKVFVVCLWARPGIKKEHLNFNVSKVQNCALCNCIKPGLHVIQSAVLEPNSFNHTHTLPYNSFHYSSVCGYVYPPSLPPHPCDYFMCYHILFQACVMMWETEVRGKERGLFWCIHERGIPQLPVVRIYSRDSQ